MRCVQSRSVRHDGQAGAERTCHHNVLWNGHDTDAEVVSAWPGVGTVGAGVEQPGSVPRPVELDVDVGGGVPGVAVVHSRTSRHHTHTRGRGAKSNGNNSRTGSLVGGVAALCTTKSLFQLVCEIFGGLGGQGERMGGRGAHPDSPPGETRLIAPNVAGSADGEVKSWGALGSTVTGHVEDKHTTTARRFLRACAAQMEKESKSSRRLELAENGEIALLFWEQAATQYGPVPSIPGFSKLLDLMILHLGSTTEWKIIAIQCSPVYGTLRFFKVDG
ncbi:hypothetical protein C8J57DRAFT_1229908 [Mycena rebaudengoi]|nr:hypothetical protein C8J57DRAFT_1229908 [Mycena rebaudengoi]